MYTTSKTVNPYSEWARRLRASDAAACAELFDATHADLLRYAIRLTLDEDAAKDIVQEAYIKLWVLRETLDPDRSIRALLYTIVRNLAFNLQRGRQREQAKRARLEATTVTEKQTIDEAIDAEVLSDRLDKWIEELPPRRREAFQLSRFDGLSHEAIAEIMDLAPRTVTNHIMLALQSLRDRLQEFRASRDIR